MEWVVAGQAALRGLRGWTTTFWDSVMSFLSFAGLAMYVGLCCGVTCLNADLQCHERPLLEVSSNDRLMLMA